LFVVAVFCTAKCRKAYDPPQFKTTNHFLAVDGFINTTANNSTNFTLTRSLNLDDTIPHFPELGAQVMIQDANGASYVLTDTGNNGIYVSDILNLDPNLKYHIVITLSGGNKYQSDPVTPKVAPPIDSLTWKLQDDPIALVPAITFYVSAHDPTNNTQYYRWDYVETWQHESFFRAEWLVRPDGHVDLRNPDEFVYDCWSTGFSSSILLGTSVTLSSDVISQTPIAKFLKNDPKMDIGYSMLLSQYPLDAEAYKYWLTIQKNSQSLGGLSDIQPSQIKGNIHGVTNPADPVFGYISASSVTQKRVFINHHESIPDWQSNPTFYCPEVFVGLGNDLVYSYPDTSFGIQAVPANGVMELTKIPCIDCRRQGGTTTKPSFWQ
jgi:hypothetical protein